MCRVFFPSFSSSFLIRKRSSSYSGCLPLNNRAWVAFFRLRSNPICVAGARIRGAEGTVRCFLGFHGKARLRGRRPSRSHSAGCRGAELREDGVAGAHGGGQPHGGAVQEEQPRRAGALVRAAGVDPHRAAPRQRRLLLPHLQVRRLLRPRAALRALLSPRRRQPLRGPRAPWRRAPTPRAVRRARCRAVAPRLLQRAPPARGRWGYVRGLRRGRGAREGAAVVDGPERARRAGPRLRLLRRRARERFLLAALLAPHVGAVWHRLRQQRRDGEAKWRHCLCVRGRPCDRALRRETIAGG